ncbi:MAG: hypothetical protein MJB14_21025 [Spirochaetes bacterium]|nr:hypothetical protein [Spirochaetota bacterium]
MLNNNFKILNMGEIFQNSFQQTFSAFQKQGKYLLTVFGVITFFIMVFFFIFINDILLPLFQEIDLIQTQELMVQVTEILNSIMTERPLLIVIIFFNNCFLLFALLFLSTLLTDLFLKKSIYHSWSFSGFRKILKQKFINIIRATLLLILIRYALEIPFSLAVKNVPQISFFVSVIIFALMRFFIFYIVVILLENQPAFGAIKRSAKLVYYHYGKILLYSFLFLLFWIAVAMAIMLFISFIGAGFVSFYDFDFQQAPLVGWIILGSVAAVCFFILFVLMMTAIHAFQVQLYFQQRIHFEDFKLEDLAVEPMIDLVVNNDQQNHSQE